MEVGIREFKARLSHYVRMARAGERVVVTERGRPVAHLTAAPSGVAPALPASLDALIAQGRVTAPAAAARWAPIAGARADRPVAAILDEDRDDG